ncbi:MAG TPA: hypothetical protein VE871_11435 [Longimicrobium sp.]|nr:hypothetical protein [Longimicrobium sp.]
MRPAPTRRQRLQVVFTFLVFFGAVMFLVGPHPTRAQILFRVALILAGIAGMAWLNAKRAWGR